MTNTCNTVYSSKKGTNTFKRMSFYTKFPRLQALISITRSTTRCALHLLKILSHSCFPNAQQKQRDCKKLCITLPSEKSHMHILPSQHKNFSPRYPPMTLPANMDFPFWRLPKPSPWGCSALSQRISSWDDALPCAETYTQKLLWVHLNELFNCKGTRGRMSSELAPALKARRWLNVHMKKKRRRSFSNNCNIIATGFKFNFVIYLNKFWQYDNSSVPKDAWFNHAWGLIHCVACGHLCMFTWVLMSVSHRVWVFCAWSVCTCMFMCM